MNNIKCVLIDDEYFNRQLIKALISKIDPDYEVVGEAEGVTEGFDILAKYNPDVVFLDIKMPDGSGFDLLKKIEIINFEVVFITGFDEFAIQAFDHNALDYVLKPIDIDKFTQTLQKVKNRLKQSVPNLDNLKEILEALPNHQSIITKIPIHYNDKVILLPVTEIAYVKADGGYTCFFKNKDEKRVSSKQFSDFEFIFSQLHNFIRISKGVYINLNFMESYTKGMECFITMKDGSVMEISRRKKSEILELLNEFKPNPNSGSN